MRDGTIVQYKYRSVGLRHAARVFLHYLLTSPFVVAVAVTGTVGYRYSVQVLQH
jgi:hypothetical protein